MIPYTFNHMIIPKSSIFTSHMAMKIRLFPSLNLFVNHFKFKQHQLSCFPGKCHYDHKLPSSPGNRFSAEKFTESSKPKANHVLTASPFGKYTNGLVLVLVVLQTIEPL